eukprot:1128410-Alexandrium_andersonii.AAC.1
MACTAAWDRSWASSSRCAGCARHATHIVPMANASRALPIARTHPWGAGAVVGWRGRCEPG